MTNPFYFVDKDPETGKRRSTPIIDIEININEYIVQFQKNGCIQLVNMRLV